MWQPRRADWKKYLTVDPSDIPPSSTEAQTNVMATLVEQLQAVRLSDVAPFANTPLPMGLWQQKPGCNFAAPPADTMSSDKFKGDARPSWFDEIALQPDAPVYSALPGQVLFDMICINCHGPNADSLGRQADTSAEPHWRHGARRQLSLWAVQSVAAGRPLRQDRTWARN